MEVKELLVSDLNSVVKLQGDFKDGWTEKSFKSSINSGLLKIFGAFEGGMLIGFISIGLSDVIDIETVFVKKEFRNRGVAILLIDSVLALAKELSVESVMLEVRSSNLPAISLYKKMGFNQISRRKNYYFDGEDALIFQRG